MRNDVFGRIPPKRPNKFIVLSVVKKTENHHLNNKFYENMKTGYNTTRMLLVFCMDTGSTFLFAHSFTDKGRDGCDKKTKKKT